MSYLPGWYLPVAAFAFGAAFGSFANVAAYRIPRGLSIVRPRSACPHCGIPIVWRDNLPLVSYLILRGRCRSCGARISARYPLIELATGFVWLLTAIRFGAAAELPAFLAMGLSLVILSAIDLEHRRLPNRVLGPAFVIAVVLLTGAAAVSRDWSALVLGFAGALAYSIPLFLIALAVPRGMGGGDVKLAAYLGLHLGWLGLAHVGAGAILGFFAGSVAGVVLIAAGKKGRKDPIPFGPFMALGALITTLAGDRIVKFWLG